MRTEDRDFNRHMIVEQIETVSMGGGQAGLAMSYYLGQLGREHATGDFNKMRRGLAPGDLPTINSC
jgi:hypothetical protein